MRFAPMSALALRRPRSGGSTSPAYVYRRVCSSFIPLVEHDMAGAVDRRVEIRGHEHRCLVFHDQRGAGNARATSECRALVDRNLTPPRERRLENAALRRRVSALAGQGACFSCALYFGRYSDRPAHDLDVHVRHLSLIHISEPTRLLSISYAVF